MFSSVTNMTCTVDRTSQRFFMGVSFLQQKTCDPIFPLALFMQKCKYSTKLLPLYQTGFIHSRLLRVKNYQNMPMKCNYKTACIILQQTMFFSIFKYDIISYFTDLLQMTILAFMHMFCEDLWGKTQCIVQ